MQNLKNYIHGELLAPQSGEYLENFSPATGEVYSKVPLSDRKDLQKAIESSQSAFLEWGNLPSSERAQFLRKIAQEIRNQAERFAEAESIDTGKPISVSRRVDIPRSAQNFDFFADAITQFSSESYASDRRTLNWVTRTPLGTVGCISPWNLPLYLLSWKIAPALAAGNTVIAKPSEVTPMTAYLLSEICQQVGLPKGVLNILHGSGSGIGRQIVEHTNVRAISFTGSTLTGSEISKVASPQFKKVSLELGGKNPTIIFSDAHLEKAAHGAVQAAFSNQGQICLCGSRIFIEKSIYHAFRSALIEKVQALKQGDPLDLQTEQGALVSQEHLNKVLGWIDLAQSEGGKVLVGGKRAHLEGRCEKGWFVTPTLIENLSPAARTNQEEIFGPVATLIPFESESELIVGVNQTRYGLSASVWTQDIDRAHRIASQIQAGMVWINSWMLRDLRTPFGGTKASGVGREGGFEALKFFTEMKNICVQYEN